VYVGGGVVGGGYCGDGGRCVVDGGDVVYVGVVHCGMYDGNGGCSGIDVVADVVVVGADAGDDADDGGVGSVCIGVAGIGVVVGRVNDVNGGITVGDVDGCGVTVAMFIAVVVVLVVVMRVLVVAQYNAWYE